MRDARAALTPSQDAHCDADARGALLSPLRAHSDGDAVVIGADSVAAEEAAASPSRAPASYRPGHRRDIACQVRTSSVSVVVVRAASPPRSPGAQTRARAAAEMAAAAAAAERVARRAAQSQRVARWIQQVARATKQIARQLYGVPWEEARRQASTHELNVVMARAFDVVGAAPAPQWSGTSFRFRRLVSSAVGFNRMTGYGLRSLSRTLSCMKPTWRPKIGSARRGLYAGVEVFVLELGAGTKPFERAVREHGLEHFNVISVDLAKTRSPTWCEDITKWRSWLPARLVEMRRRWPSFVTFHYVHFSPECTELAASKTVGKRDIASALMLALHGIALITELAPPVWTIESSGSGAHRLAFHSVMKGLARDKLPMQIHFCKFGGLGNFKPGDWWTNLPDRFTECFNNFTCRHDCAASMQTGRHPLTSQSGRSQYGTPGMRRDDLMAFPVLLPQTWLTVMQKFLYLDLYFRKASKRRLRAWVT